MRQDMEIMDKGLRAIGYRGKLTTFGFTTDEIGEIIERDKLEDMIIERAQRSWEAEPKNPPEVNEEWAHEKRAEYLKNEFANATQVFLKNKNEETAHKKSLAKLHYSLHLGLSKGVTKDEIGKAHGVPLAKLIKVENNFALCPFHSEKHNSLHITKNLYYCFGCGAGGDAIDFVQQTKFLFFKEAVKYLNVI